MRDWSRLLMCLMLLLASCEEREGVSVYDVAPPVPYDWPETEASQGLAEGFEWNVPAGLVASTDVPDALMGDYRFEGATQALPGRVTISMIYGEAGGLDANVQRWVDQMIAFPPRDLSRLVQVSPERRHPWGTFWVVHITGQFAGPNVPTSMLAAVVRIPDPADPTGPAYATWFIKLTGDRATVSGMADTMAEMIYSIRPEGTAMPDFSFPPEGPADTPADPHAGVPGAPPLSAEQREPATPQNPIEPDDSTVPGRSDESAEPEAPAQTDEPGEVSP